MIYFNAIMLIGIFLVNLAGLFAILRMERDGLMVGDLIGAIYAKMVGDPTYEVPQWRKRRAEKDEQS